MVTVVVDEEEFVWIGTSDEQESKGAIIVHHSVVSFFSGFQLLKWFDFIYSKFCFFHFLQNFECKKKFAINNSPVRSLCVSPNDSSIWVGALDYLLRFDCTVSTTTVIIFEFCIYATYFVL
jgi:hypothetical protein